ncbi:acyltransferase-like protein At1g54570, chloroplastic isoform X2 [Telopea speciosissima]|uniref:acyltransferase-like protein At1g54570, chloroplastic isoform X2 n=1 Tax=Telopea speciosissima TaxID=54955 RepID=UPI001CC55190|nr:acyltransferase-like protein At1g54570, chloroplastic isoform X2 [Telopea speciosissima]
MPSALAFSSSIRNWILPSLPVSSEFKCSARLRVHVSATGNRSVLPSDTVGTDGPAPLSKEDGRIGSGASDGGNGRVGSNLERKRLVKDTVSEELEVLWDDGFGEETVKDYLDISKEMIKPDGGPPRWFCPVACGPPIKESPLLLFLPGMDGVGLGLLLHHKPLGRVFEVRCMHIPVYDRTPFEGLVKFVENILVLEHTFSPNKPIYLVGDSLGGCLALAVAARNPTIDLVLVLVNPATSFGKSQLQPLLPVLKALPDELHITVPYLLSFIMGDPMKMALVNVEYGLPPAQKLEHLSRNLTSLLPRLSGLADIIPKETLLWKLKLLKTGAAYANSRLHAVKSDVLVLASGKDNMLPSGAEAQRLSTSLQNCKIRYFKDNGHTLLLEDGINLLTIIKATNMYRRSRRHDYVSEFIPPSMTEFKEAFDEMNGFFRLATSPVIFSTLKDGKIVRSLSGIPNEGPVLLVGYHMLLGLELSGLVEAFLREKKVMVRGIAHPLMFSDTLESSLPEFSRIDLLKIFGASPVSASNLFKLLSTKSYVLLYPGGAREALHRKGEEYKLFWPEQPEFVRMAARFGATIVPFGVIGEDDVGQLVLDYNDLINIPFVGDWIKDLNQKSVKLRTDAIGEVANEELYYPGILPKLPGRFYYLFGKPIETKGRMDVLKERENANVLYLQVRSEIESMISYLIKKREEDPYRGLIERTVYRAISAPVDEIPTFGP